MKKSLILLLLLIVVTGCSIVRIDTSNIDNIIDVVLSKQNKLTNVEGHGYKYYIPRGVTHVETNEQINKLYCNGDYYYLYIDTVGFYYKTKLKYKENEDKYYSKLIDKKEKGYLDITKKDKFYYVDFYYNYARIEAVVTKENLMQTILNSSYILSTVKYNKSIVSLMLEEDYFTNKTGKYDIFDNTNKSKKFELKVEEDG